MTHRVSMTLPDGIYDQLQVYRERFGFYKNILTFLFSQDARVDMLEAELDQVRNKLLEKPIMIGGMARSESKTIVKSPPPPPPKLSSNAKPFIKEMNEKFKHGLVKPSEMSDLHE